MLQNDEGALMWPMSEHVESALRMAFSASLNANGTEGITRKRRSWSPRCVTLGDVPEAQTKTPGPELYVPKAMRRNANK